MRLSLAILMGVALPAASAAGGDLRLEFRDGHVTLDAREVPVRQILSEWERLGNTRIVNAEKVQGGPVTLQLTDVPEKQALEVVLRSVSGYVAAPRTTHEPGRSAFDRILVMATSSPPRTAPPGPAPPRPPMAEVPPPVMVDDQGEPIAPQPDGEFVPDGPEQLVQPPGLQPQPGVQPGQPFTMPPGFPPQPQPDYQYEQQPGVQPQPGMQPGLQRQPGIQPAPAQVPGAPGGVPPVMTVPGPTPTPGGAGAIVSPTPGPLPLPPPPQSPNPPQ